MCDSWISGLALLAIYALPLKALTLDWIGTLDTAFG